MHVVAAALLGAVFVLSGVAKLVDVGGWTAQAAAFGVPAVFSVPVPFVELGVGATVAVRLAEPVPAIIALLLLVAFSLLIAWQLGTGRRPPCACFGAWSARPISWRHLARNAAFSALAVLVLVT